MEGRISAWILTLPLAVFCTGCVATDNQKNLSSTPTPNPGPPRETPTVVKKQDGPKRNPKPATEIAFGRMKELEAEGEIAKKQPEMQARLRDEARQAYQKALKLDPNSLEAAHYLGRLYNKIGDYPRAMETFRQAMARHPNTAGLWYDIGLCHQRKREIAESVRCFRKALDLDPENREYMKKLGFTLAYLGNVDQGLTYLVRAHGAALGHYNLARVLIQKDQTILAQQHLRLALRENGQLQDARELLASLETPGSDTRATAVNGQISRH